MAVTPEQAAKHLCRAADWEIIPLALPKALFLAQGGSLANFDEPLVSGNPFVATESGPTIPSLDKLTSPYGNHPILEKAFDGVEDIDPDSWEADVLNQAGERFRDYRLAPLHGLCMDPDGAWAKHLEHDRLAMIPDVSIQAEHKAMMAAGKKREDMTVKVLEKGDGWVIQCQLEQVDPDKPPFAAEPMVIAPGGKSGAPYSFALNTQEVFDRNMQAQPLPADVLGWLESQSDEVEAFLSAKGEDLVQEIHAKGAPGM